ncbi:MAG TPA: lytic transglycosylase domain-containing protein [Thermoanaerobaculia bacterium]
MALTALRRKWVVAAVTIPVIAAIVVVTVLYYSRAEQSRAEGPPPAKPAAPPDLEKLREKYTSGVDAILRNDPASAVKYLSSFSFGPRAVEEYRLYYLAGGESLSGSVSAARFSLTHLWSRNPRMVFADDAGLDLAAMHAAAGDAIDSALVYDRIAFRTDKSGLAAVARWNEFQQRMAAGDIAGAVRAVRRIVVASPRSPQVADAIAVLRSVWSLDPTMPLRLTPEERVERAVSFLRDGDPRNALDELTAFEPYASASLKDPVVLNRGLALYQMRRFDEAIRVLETLTSGSYKFAIPALYHLSKSYRVLANSIDPTVTKVITEKKNVNVKVRTGKGKAAKTITKPRVVITRRTVKLVDLVKKAKKDSYDHLADERLKDLLSLPLSKPVRVEVLNTLIAVAEAKNQDESEQQMIASVIKLDPLSDPGLQHFWDKAWSAYAHGDMNGSKALFRYISDTYTNPNVKRGGDYWYARSIDRLGQKEDARAIFQRLASAPYLDFYAMSAVAHGATHHDDTSNPLQKTGPDWREIAEKEIPDELRLAYELTALTDFRDARAEIQRNQTQFNDRYGQALLAELYNSTGNTVLMQRAVKRAFPQIATVEQDSAPVYFLKMYYPVKYVDSIKKYAARNGLDPYLVMGLILQESSFIPNAKSAVGATGLMQLMPPTAKELAKRLHVPFGQARLENPEVNVELGTAHLKMLVNMFNGNALLAVASYNAGQGNVLKWKRSAPGRPMDEFVESIPFPETRNYVKRVTMLRSSYARMAQ